MAEASSISLQFSEQQKEAFSKAFGPFQTKKEEQEAMQRFATMALAAFFDWITAAKRYRSLTEQYIDWIEGIYKSLVAPTEAPSVDRIYNSLNVPHGQATYIARVLASKTLVHWRRIATEELRTALKKIEKSARDYAKQGDKTQPINIQVSQIAVHELLRVCSARRRLDTSYLMPQQTGASGDFRFVAIPASTVADLVDNSNW